MRRLILRMGVASATFVVGVLVYVIWTLGRELGPERVSESLSESLAKFALSSLASVWCFALAVLTGGAERKKDDLFFPLMMLVFSCLLAFCAAISFFKVFMPE